jgi:AbrB family looped-hinge helix DNA binding protein
MKTGIIRRIDDLGRIVIPKEIRRKFNIHEGDPLEISLDGNKICFELYIPSNDYEDKIMRIINDLEKDDYLTSDLTSLQNDLTSAKAEIDYWKRNAFDGCMERGRIEKTAKAEAYKEFAERLKEKYGYYDWENKTIVYPDEEIDNLLKELMGDSDA